jgi:transposase InsO family protein
MKELQKQGYPIGRYRVRSLMKKHSLRVQKRNHFRVTTDSKYSHQLAANLLDHRFDVKGSYQVWAGDIAYIRTLTGWMYLATVMNLHSRRIVGWAMKYNMKVELTLNALAMAYFQRKQPAGLLHHSDRGSQYALRQRQSVCTPTVPK